MKKLLLVLIAALGGYTSFSQGLENIIVEKYYISDANDASVNSVGGILPVGSVTYRIYVDMLPDYIFQAAYGDGNHACTIQTNTLFFNNEDRGATTPTFSKNFCDDNTVMLDSWLSVGAACAGNFGILKSLDDGVATVVNGDGVLQNTDPNMGVPLTAQDGFILGTPQPVTAVGITTEMAIFDAQNDGTNGPIFTTNNGSWASLNGSVGPDSVVNQVLIAQMTTDGVFSFQLNIQIRNNITNAVENYVASNPIGNEVLFPGLTYSSNTGISEDSKSDVKLNLYPNPSHGNATLEIVNMEANSQSNYVIYDVIGSKVFSKDLGMISGSHTEILDLNTLTNGFYFIELNMGDVSKTLRIVKN